MNQKSTIVEVYTPKPELTIYRDTYLKCELIDKRDKHQSRLKVISVHTAKNALLSDLTAERVDEIIMVENDNVFYSIDDLKDYLRTQY